VDHAVKQAASAFPAWRDTPIKERAQVLFRFRQALIDDVDALAAVVSSESGKTVAEARAGIEKGIEVVEYATSLQNQPLSGALEVSRGVTCQTTREPLGVTVGITPFNFPAMVPLWMLPISLAMGNAFILKPSEKVPLTAVRLGRHLEAAGVPPGVFSIVHGSKTTVEALATHKGVAAVAFVGSTPAARAVYGMATAQGKRALCLGGAKNHLIVTKDATPSLTIPGVVSSFIGCAGQRCMAASVMVVVGQGPGIDATVDGVIAAAKSIELGRDMGAIITSESLTRLHRAIDQATEQGATLRLDGRTVPAPASGKGGYWLGPTIIDHATPQMQAVQTELFGPVLTIVRVPKLDDAIALANRSPYGNATSVFTESGAVAQFVAQRSTAGMIGVNIGVPVPREPFSFGGTKSSRFGTGDITGEGGVNFWSSTKKVTTKWSSQNDSSWMS
jgi:malonate-semialdehyde dehydrogenase (acetylating)/methylmalonate-semialdehyde dehydrogenase